MKKSWTTYKVGDLFDVQLGKMLNKKARQGNNQFPYLANFNVQWGTFALAFLNQMTFDDREKRKFELLCGDLLMCEGGEIGRCAVWQGQITPCYYQKALHRLRPRDGKISSEFMCLYMQHMATGRGLTVMVGESSIAHLTREKLISMSITIPIRYEQDKITETIKTWDTAIEKTEKLIEAKEKQYAFELTRLISKSKHKRAHVSSIAHEVTLRNRESACARVLSVTNSNGFVLPEEQFERRVASEDLSNYKTVCKGQYAYNPSRINVGSIARLDGFDMGVLSPMYVVFRLNETAVNSDYFQHWLASHEARQRIRNSAQGSVRETVSFAEFSAIVIPLPGIQTQIIVVEYLNNIRQEIDLLKKQAEAYRTQKRGLMQKLLTGEWRVKAGKEVAG